MAVRVEEDRGEAETKWSPWFHRESRGPDGGITEQDVVAQEISAKREGKKG